MQKKSTKICFILNPAANRHRSIQKADWIRKEASNLWYNYEVVIAGENEPLAELARLKSITFDVVVACGGDGTISQIVNGLAESNCALGVMPVGSGNDFVKSLGIKKSLPHSLQVLYQNRISEIDLIRYEGDVEGWCANTIGFGIDGWANYYAHQANWLKGRITYYYGAVKAIFKFHGSITDIRLSSHTEKDTYLMITVCNGKWEGGSFLVAPNAKLHDGKLDILTIKKVPIPFLILYLLRFRWGPAKWMKGVNNMRAESLDIFSDLPVAVHRDGEHLGKDIQNIRLKLKRKALKVIVPDNY